MFEIVKSNSEQRAVTEGTSLCLWPVLFLLVTRLFGEASGFLSIQVRGGISRLAHGASLLPSASSKLRSALGYLACLHGSTMDFSQEGMREKRGPLTSTHQAGSNPAADATHMLWLGSGLSKVVAVHSNATAQHYAKALAEFSISSTS